MIKLFLNPSLERVLCFFLIIQFYLIRYYIESNQFDLIRSMESNQFDLIRSTDSNQIN